MVEFISRVYKSHSMDRSKLCINWRKLRKEPYVQLRERRIGFADQASELSGCTRERSITSDHRLELTIKKI